MGNCIVLQAKVIRVIRTDGKILEYKAPMKVYQVLSEFKSHAISDSLPVVQHLHADADMHGGCLYYLLPEPAPPSPKPAKRKVKFADQVEEEVHQQIRIKLVISKQELKSMLSEEGISLNDIVCHLQNKGRCNDQINRSDDDEVISKGWKPMLDSVPETD